MSFKSLAEGISGLQSQMKKLEVIGNNLANLTTAGFKKDRVTFQDMYYDMLAPASEGSGNIGGTNPMEIGTGVDVASIDTIHTQGARQNTGRSLDFMIDGKDFFVAKNGSSGELLLTRNGAFQLDGNMNLVDNVGNKIQGFNVDAETQVSSSDATDVIIETGPINPNATTEVDVSANIDSSLPENKAGKEVEVWKLFSGGENYGDFEMAIRGGSGSRDSYGSGYYSDSYLYQQAVGTTTGMTLLNTDGGADYRFVAIAGTTYGVDGTLSTVGTGVDTLTFGGAPAGFSVGDVVTISQINSSGSLIQEEVKISAISGGVVTFDSNLETGFTLGADDVLMSRSEAQMTTGGTLAAATTTAPTITIATTGFAENDTISVYQRVGTALIYQEAIIKDITGGVITLGGALSGFANGAGITIAKVIDSGFRSGNQLSLLDSTGSSPEVDQKEIASSTGGILALTGNATTTLVNTADGVAGLGGLTGTNLTLGSSTIGSNSTGLHNDVLKSQISVVNAYGNIIASFYRVGSNPADYTRGTAETSSGSSFTMAVGEFTSWLEFKELLEAALDDDELTNNVASDSSQGSQNLNIGIDKFGQISLGGTGVVKEMQFVVNQDNESMRSMLSGLVYEGDAGDTQALVNQSGTVRDSSATLLSTQRSASANATTAWYQATGIENYGYSSTNPSTGYGEYAGLRLDGGADGELFGRVTVELTNGLGEVKQKTFKVVPRNADPSEDQFTTLGELVLLMQSTLRSKDFSSVSNNGQLVADGSASVSLTNGRIVVATSDGVFNNMTITADNADLSDDSVGGGLVRSDQVNFGTVLGDLSDGVYGKEGKSNKFIEADAMTQTTIYDNKGNQHTALLLLVQDRSQSLTNTEWKFKTTLNPNLNTFVQNDPDNILAYRDTFNSIQDNGSTGVLAFGLENGAVLSADDFDSDARYSNTASIEFSPQQGGSLEAADMDTVLNFDGMTSFNGANTVISRNVDGFASGFLVRIASEQNTGNITGVYSNGKTRTLAKIGLMSIANPGGLEKIGMNNYRQTVNSSSNGNTQGLDQVYAVNANPPAGVDSVTSKINGASLEASNVDLTEELTEMIITQRAYSASGKSITSADQLLQEALNLIR